MTEKKSKIRSKTELNKYNHFMNTIFITYFCVYYWCLRTKYPSSCFCWCEKLFFTFKLKVNQSQSTSFSKKMDNCLASTYAYGVSDINWKWLKFVYYLFQSITLFDINTVLMYICYFLLVLQESCLINKCFPHLSNMGIKLLQLHLWLYNTNHFLLLHMACFQASSTHCFRTFIPNYNHFLG